MAEKSKPERYIESFVGSLELQSKLRERAKEENITVSMLIRRAIEKELAMKGMQVELLIPMRDKFDMPIDEPLSNVLSSAMFSIRKIIEREPELIKAFIRQLQTTYGYRKNLSVKSLAFVDTIFPQTYN